MHQLCCGIYNTINVYNNYVMQDGESPLIDASRNGHVQVVAELLQHGARVDLQDKV